MADPDASLTPEKRLLKLIEDPQSATPGQKAVQAQAGISAYLSPSALKGRIAFFKDQAVQFFKDPKEPINLRLVNRVARLGAVGLAIYLFAMIGLEISSAYRDYNKEFKLVARQMTELPESELRKADTSLFDEIERRNIFISQEKRAPVETQDTQVTSTRLVDMIKDLRLTGISVDPDSPERTFCMIEDIKRNVTSFLKVGDMIAGLKVAQINQDAVLLKQQKESIELR